MGILAEALGRNARIAVLETLLKNRGKIRYMSGLAEETGLSHSRVSRVIKDLVNIGLVGEEPLGKQTKIFRLNDGTKLTCESFSPGFGESGKNNSARIN